MLPYFILHTSKDTFPDSVKIDELGKNPYIADLEIISTFKKELFIGDDQQRIANNQNKVNLDFNEKINEFHKKLLAKTFYKYYKGYTLA